MKTISNQDFTNAIASGEYTNSQKTILKNLYNQKQLLTAASTTKNTTSIQIPLNDPIVNPDMQILYEKLRTMVLTMNGNNKESHKIIAALIKLIMDDQIAIKEKQNVIIQHLNNLYNKD